MDMNKALSAHQIALIRASDADFDGRQQHLHEVADHIADHISWYQGLNNAPCARLLPAKVLRSNLPSGR
jgi:hypothetical protein